MENTNLFVTDAERYQELENLYKFMYDSSRVKMFMEGNEDKVQFVKENYPLIIDYLKKEYPDDVGGDVYYTDTKQIDNRKIVALATHNFFGMRSGQHHINSKEAFEKGLNWLVDIGESVTWSREKYIRNFPAILTYLEQQDGMDVSEIREMHRQDVEEKKHNPTYQSWGEMKILEPGPSVETRLMKLVARAKEEEFRKYASVDNPTYAQAMKYFKVTALNEVLKQQKQILKVNGGRIEKFA